MHPEYLSYFNHADRVVGHLGFNSKHNLNSSKQHELILRIKVVNLVRRRVVNLNRPNMVLLNRRRVVSYTGVCILVTDAYNRMCSITGEKTLPVLDAAHIKPYVESGPHFISNGILLRSDIHKLFDTGYLTITDELKVEVSCRIKEEFQNGKEYYQYHGKELAFLPSREIDKPDKKYIDWHNINIYKG